MNTSKTILVLPGTKWQVPLVKKIHEMGYQSIVVNPAVDSPAFAYADEQFVSDIFAKENYLPQLKNYRISAVLSEECDIATRLVAELADELQVPSQGCDMAELYTNKVRMREFLWEHRLPCPEFKICHTIDEALDFYHSLNRQMIIKPIDSNSSHGVFTVRSKKDLIAHFEEAMSFSRMEKAVICERYIQGTEFTVDGIKTQGGHACLAVSEKKHYPYNENIAYELFFSYDNSKYDYNKLRQVNDTFVNLSGLPFGLTHAEYKYEDGEFYLIEIGARGGGNLISAEIVPCLSGYDNYDALIRMALGETIYEIPSVPSSLRNRSAVLEFFDVPEKGGVVTAIQGVDILRGSKNILSYKFNFKIGDTIRQAENDSARVGYYIAYAESRQELMDVMDKIKKEVRIVV